MKREESEGIFKIIEEIYPILDGYPIGTACTALIYFVVFSAIHQKGDRERIIRCVNECWNILEEGEQADE